MENPENYYRDPCPDTRPESRCNALDEYVWRKDPNYKWEVVETYKQYDSVIGYSGELVYEIIQKSSFWNHLSDMNP